MRKRTRRARIAVIMMGIFMLLTGMTVKSQAKEDMNIEVLPHMSVPSSELLLASTLPLPSHRSGTSAAKYAAQGPACSESPYRAILTDGADVCGRTNIDTEYYDLLEEEYLDQVREVLKEEGYSNCGLTLTFSRDADGVRNYDLSVHHRRFEKLDEAGKEEILEKLEMISFVEKVEPAFLEM